MALSVSEQAMADGAYRRVHTKYRNGFVGVGLGASLGLSSPVIKYYCDPRTSHQERILLVCLIGIFLAICATASFMISRQRKQDLELVAFFEKHFPEDCSWKQEEKILAAAEDIRLKAKVARLIQQQA